MYIHLFKSQTIHNIVDTYKKSKDWYNQLFRFANTYLDDDVGLIVFMPNGLTYELHKNPICLKYCIKGEWICQQPAPLVHAIFNDMMVHTCTLFEILDTPSSILSTRLYQNDFGQYGQYGQHYCIPFYTYQILMFCHVLSNLFSFGSGRHTTSQLCWW